MRARKCIVPLLCSAAMTILVEVSGCSGQSHGGFLFEGGSSNGGSSGDEFDGSGESGSGSSGSRGGFGSSSGGSASGGGSPSSSGGFGSSSGSVSGSTGGSTSGSASGSTSGSGSGVGEGGATCTAAVATGAISLASNYLASSVIGDGGYAYSYDDGMGSTACLDSTALCGAGTTAVATPTGTVWGAGIGFSLNQAMATGPTSPPVGDYAVPAASTGIAYALSVLPAQGMRLIIDEAGTDYCAALTAATGTVLWSSFNTECWSGAGTSLSGAPQVATHVQFQVTAASASLSFEFCMTAVSFAQ